MSFKHCDNTFLCFASFLWLDRELRWPDRQCGRHGWWNTKVRACVRDALAEQSLIHYFSFQPVLHNWCNKGHGMCYPICRVVYIKEPLMLIGIPWSGSSKLSARVILYAQSHRQDSTYHSLCYTSCGALDGSRNSSMSPPWGIDPTTYRTNTEKLIAKQIANFIEQWTHKMEKENYCLTPTPQLLNWQNMS